MNYTVGMKTMQPSWLSAAEGKEDKWVQVEGILLNTIDKIVMKREEHSIYL